MSMLYVDWLRMAMCEVFKVINDTVNSLMFAGLMFAFF